MKKLIFILIIIPVICFSSSAEIVSPATCLWISADLCMLYSATANGIDFHRDLHHIGLYAYMETNTDDVGKVFYFKVKDLAGNYVFESEYKIALDSKNCCPTDLGCTQPYPQGYQLFWWDELNREWQKKGCLKSKSIEIFDFKYYLSSTTPMGYFYSSSDWGERLKIGHKIIEFYRENELKASGDLWITPGFGDSDDIIYFGGKPVPRVSRDGGEDRNTYGIVSTSQTAQHRFYFRCKDWENANATLSNYGYYPSMGSSKTGHIVHQSGRLDLNLNEDNGDCPCSFGSISPTEGSFSLNDNVPVFSSTWTLGSTSGWYGLTINMSKEFEGRNFEHSKTYNIASRFLNMLSMPSTSEVGSLYVIKPCQPPPPNSSSCDYDYHCTSTSFYDRFVRVDSYDMIVNVLRGFYRRISYEPQAAQKVLSVTSASIEGGGCFDCVPSGTNWTCLHQKHRMGHNVDFKKVLVNPNDQSDTYEISSFKFLLLQYEIHRRYPQSGSFCNWHNRNTDREHIHCRFYNGWYN